MLRRGVAEGDGSEAVREWTLEAAREGAPQNACGQERRPAGRRCVNNATPSSVPLSAAQGAQPPPLCRLAAYARNRGPGHRRAWPYSQ